MLMTARDSLLWIVDVQERLLPTIQDGEAVAWACGWLLDIAAELAVPSGASEQYPRGLGRTVPALRERLDAGMIAEKQDFSCARASNCLEQIECRGRRQIVLCGIEAHVCLLQTAIELRERGYAVFVVADAVGSRRATDRETALARLGQSGVAVVTREMVAFEWLARAGTDTFRRISREYLR